MQVARLAYGVLWVLAAFLPGPVLAEEPVHGLIQLDYIMDRPEAGGSTGDAEGYAVTLGYEVAEKWVAFAEYERVPHPLLAPAFGDTTENDYEAGGKFTFPVNAILHWVTALGYEVEKDTAASGSSRESGYDFVQGLRIEAASHLELVADLHHETIGPATNELVLGFVRGFGSRYAVVAVGEHSVSQGRYSDSVHLGLRFYY